MAGTSDFLDLASTSVTVFQLSTTNNYGHPVHSTAGTTYPAVVEYGDRLVITSEGRQVVASATVYVLSTTAEIGVQDLVTLPRDTSARLLRANPVNDEEGLHHWELVFA